jgi:hypothetical protein
MADAAVMTWGGLRGAVGLALAIQVYNDRAPNTDGEPQIGVEQARRVLFYVGGIAFLTTIINATTCPILVNWLNITAQTDSKQQLMRVIQKSLVAHAQRDTHPPGVQDSLRKALAHLADHIDHAKTQHDRPNCLEMSDSNVFVEDFMTARSAFQRLNDHDLELCGYDNETNMLISGMIREASARETALLEIIANPIRPADQDMAMVFTGSFLSLVQSSYWRQIESRTLRPGSEEVDILLHSVQMGLSYPQPILADFKIVFAWLLTIKHGEDELSENVELKASFRQLTKSIDGMPRRTASKRMTTALDRRHFLHGPLCFVEWSQSSTFQGFMAAAIISNGLYIAVEEKARSPDDDSRAWGVIEILFTLIFFSEFLFKVIAFRLGYFLSAWNLFDFFLVITGVFGCIVDLMAESNGGETTTATGSEARLIRMTRVFKVARLLRLIRLFNLGRLLIAKLEKQELNLQNGEHLKKYSALTAYTKAHLHAQRDLLLLLCPKWGARRPTRASGMFLDEEKSDMERVSSRHAEGEQLMPLEMAIILIESQAAIYTAVVLAVGSVNSVDKDTLEQLNQIRESCDIVEEMEQLIIQFQSKGVINGTEAESILHPLHDHIRHCQTMVSKSLQGYVMTEELGRELSSEDYSNGHGGSSSGSLPKMNAVVPIVDEPGFCSIGAAG